MATTDNGSMPRHEASFDCSDCRYEQPEVGVRRLLRSTVQQSVDGARVHRGENATTSWRRRRSPYGRLVRWSRLMGLHFRNAGRTIQCPYSCRRQASARWWLRPMGPGTPRCSAVAGTKMPPSEPRSTTQAVRRFGAQRLRTMIACARAGSELYPTPSSFRKRPRRIASARSLVGP